MPIRASNRVIEYKGKVYDCTAEELAEKVGYNAQYIRQIARKSQIPAIRVGKRWMFCYLDVVKSLVSFIPGIIISGPEEAKETVEELF